MAEKHRTGRGPEKAKACSRRHYLKHREAVKAKVAARYKPYAEWSPQKRAAHVLRKTVERRQRGVPIRGEAAMDELARSNARQAWLWWLKTCPDWWMRAYYRAKGRPWNNPRLSGADRWRIRYWCDPAFRAKEIEKVQTLKVKRAERIAAQNDGTLNGHVIVSLFANATHCMYCFKPMRSVEKSLDHVNPLSNGGMHSITNVVVCCKDCNTRKGRKVTAHAVPGQLICGGASA